MVYVEDMNYTQWKEKYVDGGEKGVANLGESGISGKEKTSNSNNLVDLEYIKSSEYKSKFDKITDDKKINKSIYEYSKAILIHRNKTNMEDLYLIDSQTGDLFGGVTNSKTDFGVNYTDKLRKKISSFPKDRLISIHNHPTNNPPTGSDFGSAGYNGYKFGVVVCHNGAVFKYNVGEIAFTSDSFDKYVDSYIKKRI